MLTGAVLLMVSFGLGAHLTNIVHKWRNKRRIECGYSDAGKTIAFVIYDGPNHITHAIIPISMALAYAERLAGKRHLPKGLDIIETPATSTPYRGDAFVDQRPKKEYTVPHWAVAQMAKWLIKELPKLRELAA